MFGGVNIVWFILLVLMFVVSIMFLIISPNVISILLRWDGLGLVSCLLVISYQKGRSYGAGMLNASSNRIGDAALLKVIAWIINFGSWRFICYLEFISGSDMSDPNNYVSSQTARISLRYNCCVTVSATLTLQTSHIPDNTARTLIIHNVNST